MSSKYNFTYFTELPAILYNENDSITKVFLRINTEDLLYESDEDYGVLKARYSIHYDLFSSYTDNKIIDSSTFYFVDSLGVTGLIFKHDFDIKAMEGQNYIVRLNLKDLNSGEVVTDYLKLSKKVKNTRNDFLVLEKSGNFLDYAYVNSNEEFFIRNENNPDVMIIRYYNRAFPVALPPFVNDEIEMFDYNADSIFIVNVSNGIAHLSFPEFGFYHIQTDTLKRDGISLFNFYSGFPKLMNSLQLMEPLRYISSKDEYDNLRSQADPKLAVDQFWLENAGNPMRARNMIKKFYNRVVDANIFFSSYHEGWKTDRGLVYIVFGPPQLVYCNDESEEWIYGEEGHSNSIRFQFYNVENPFTDNDYSLLKSSAFKEKWYEAVNMWRR